MSPNKVIAIAAVERGEDDSEFFCPESMEAKGRPEPSPEAIPAPSAAPEASAAPATPPAPASAAPVAVPPPVPASVAKELPGEMQGSQGVDPALRLKRNKAALAGKTKNRLDVLASMLNNNPGTRLELIVHTDGNKGQEKSLAISQKQAQFLIDHVAKAGIDAGRLTATGKGMSEPIGDNKTSKGREKNRRVEVRFSLAP